MINSGKCTCVVSICVVPCNSKKKENDRVSFDGSTVGVKQELSFSFPFLCVWEYTTTVVDSPVHGIFMTSTLTYIYVLDCFLDVYLY